MIDWASRASSKKQVLLKAGIQESCLCSGSGKSYPHDAGKVHLFLHFWEKTTVEIKTFFLVNKMVLEFPTCMLNDGDFWKTW